MEIIQATVIKQNQALRLRARKECFDRDGKERVTGEEWLVRSVGAYLPAVFEEVLDLVDAVILTEKVCAWVLAVFRGQTTCSERAGSIPVCARGIRSDLQGHPPGASSRVCKPCC